MRDIEKQIARTRAVLERTRWQRMAAQTHYEETVFGDRKRIAEVERKLSHTARYSRAHCYVDALRGDNNSSPYIMKRQAIMCMIMHNLEIMKYQQVLMETHHQETLDRMYETEGESEECMSVRYKDLSERILAVKRQGEQQKSLLLQKIEVQLATIQRLKNSEGLLEELGPKEEEEQNPRMGVVKGIFDNVQKRKDEFKNQLQRHVPNVSVVFHQRQQPGRIQKMQIVAEGA